MEGSELREDTAKELLVSMKELSGQISQLLSIVEQSNKDLYDEYQAGMRREQHKLDRLLAQNEQLGKALLAVHDALSDRGVSVGDDSEYPLPPLDISERPLRERKKFMRSFK